MKQNEVLITGAGPTGLVLALWLTKLGIVVRIIDKTAEPGTTSRALAVHARTLELYSQLDLTNSVIEKGYKVPAVGLWVEGEREARLSLEDVGADVTPYPFLHIFPQDEHEELLIARLKALGVSVERQTELLSYADTGSGIVAQLRGPDGMEETVKAAYIAGCDGARSLVRQIMGSGFPGGTYKQVFYVADIEATGASLNGELAVDLDESDFVAVFPLAKERRARLVGIVRDERAKNAEALSFDDVSRQAMDKLKITVEKINWFSTYHIHHRVTEQFRKGRAFLLGDAAHIHSPVGGQGMNTGIGDAINLAWKLQTVLHGRAGDTLLDSYEAERKPFAERLVNTTDRAFALVTADGMVADFVRTRVVPLVLPAAVKFEAMREWMFRTVSQTKINYRSSPLSEGAIGEVRSGDRLPWVSVNGIDNYASLSAMTWQVHIYGEATDVLSAWCREQGIPLQSFAWHQAYEDADLERDAIYLLRPDTYVAFIDRSTDPARLEDYFRTVGIRPGRSVV